MTKKQRFWNLAAIYAVGFLQMGGVGMSPVLAKLGEAFPQYSATAIQYVSSLPSIMVVVTNFFTGWLCERFPKKYIVACGCGLALAFALLAACFHSSLLLLYVWAAILGIATSLSCTVSLAIVNEMFEPKECVSIFGTRACFTSLGTMLMTFACGQLINTEWYYGFLVYLIMIPGLVLSLACHPKNTKLAKVSGQQTASDGFSVRKLIFPCSVSFFVSLLYSTAMINTSMLVAESSFIPTESAASMGGVLTTVLLAVGGAVGFLVDRISEKVGLQCITVGIVGLVLGYLGIFAAKSVAVLVGSSLLCGGTLTLVMPHTQMLGAKAGGKRQELGLSITLIFSNLGTMFGPLMTNAAEAAFNTSEVRYRFLLAAILAAFTAIAVTVHIRHLKGAKT